MVSGSCEAGRIGRLSRTCSVSAGMSSVYDNHHRTSELDGQPPPYISQLSGTKFKNLNFRCWTKFCKPSPNSFAEINLNFMYNQHAGHCKSTFWGISLQGWISQIWVSVTSWHLMLLLVILEETPWPQDLEQGDQAVVWGWHWTPVSSLFGWFLKAKINHLS